MWKIWIDTVGYLKVYVIQSVELKNKMVFQIYLD